MPELEMLQKELRKILGERKPYKRLPKLGLSRKPVISIKKNEPDYLVFGIPSRFSRKTFKKFLRCYKKGGKYTFYYSPEKDWWYSTLFPVDKGLFERALDELSILVEKDSESKQYIPVSKLVDFYSFLIGYFRKDFYHLNIKKAIAGETGLSELDATQKAFCELKEEHPLSYCRKSISAMNLLVEELEKCDYKNKKEMKKIEEMVGRAKKFGIDTEAFGMQLDQLKLQVYSDLFEEKDQGLPAKIKELKEKEPKKALDLSKLLERKARQVIRHVKAEEENISKLREYLRYFKECGVDSEEARSKAKEKFGEIKKKFKQDFSEVKKQFKDKLKELSGLEEQLGT